MTTTETTKPANTLQQWTLPNFVRRRLESRRILATVSILVAAGVAIAAAANWSWLVVSGAASVLSSALPCLLLCGLGLCIRKFSGGAGAGAIASAATEGSADSTPAATSDLATSIASCCSGARHCSPAMIPTKDASIQPREKNDA